MLTARTYIPHSHAPVSDHAVLTYDDRFLRRKVIPLASGAQLRVDLATTTSLDHGGRLVTEDGQEIEIRAADEPLLRIAGADLVRLAWHIGNRHTPCQIAADHLLIRRDKVLRDMLAGLGADLTEVTAPFVPEGGAYGMGRTHGHDHSHVHVHVGHGSTEAEDAEEPRGQAYDDL